jgi:hypothetical protein
MPLNISIDVDGTILDANENLVPQARENIERLKNAGHCLQLWSAGGADYAYKQALKNKLTDLFESYAKKPDIAIDDLPETARPLAVVHVDKEHSIDQAVEKVFGIEQNVDAALTLNSKLVSFVKKLQAEAKNIEERYGEILCSDIPLHPIPFFGVVEKARVVTVGLNPSTTEFTEARLWPLILTPCELTQRLVRYFQLPEVMPHCWFADLERGLAALHCPYHFAAAHIDIIPWATHAPSYLKNNPDFLQMYNKLLKSGIQTHLPNVLEFCKDTVKLVIVTLSSDKPKAEERSRLPLIENTIRQSVGNSVEIVIKTRSEFCQWAIKDQKRIIRLLNLENVFP